ncbi:MAG: ABC transporter permease [Actinobacteria bacterium]|nr:ABC transporter permease [Actinomycetota bacterium]
MNIRIDRANTTLIVVSLLSLLTGSFIVYRKNRILDGFSKTAFQVTGHELFILMLLIFSLVALIDLILPLLERKREGLLRIFQIALLSSILALVLTIVGNEASSFDKKFGEYTRVSFGYSFWIFLACIALLKKRIYNSISNQGVRFFTFCLVILVLVIPFLNGSLKEISIMKEYRNYIDTFNAEFRRHLFLSLGSVLAAIIIGVPLGVLTARRDSIKRRVFEFLNVIQVVPTLSLIGFLMIPLSWVGERFSVAQSIGIRGVGWAPAFIVLFLYAIYPIVRNTVAAIDSLSEGYLEVARGIGLSSRTIFLKIELPLSLSVITAGIKVALVQTSAGTILAALVGGGGLGVFIFLGLAQTAQDLVFLGLLPIVFLSFFYQGLMNLIEKIIFRRGFDGFNQT